MATPLFITRAVKTTTHRLLALSPFRLDSNSSAAATASGFLPGLCTLVSDRLCTFGDRAVRRPNSWPIDNTRVPATGFLVSGKEDLKALDCTHSNNNEPVEMKIGKRISSVEKQKFLINTLLDLKDSKETIYGTLDAWVAWEHKFPLITLKRALIVLEKEEQWHRVVQVIKWILSKGQGTTMGTYEQLIRALEKDNRAEEAHRIWVNKIGDDLHSVPWRFCDLMLSIYYRNNMLDRLVKLFQALETFNRKPQSRSVIRKVGDAYEVLGLLEEKNKLLEKYDTLFNETSDQTSRKSQKSKRVKGMNNGIDRRFDVTAEASSGTQVDSGPSDAEIDSKRVNYCEYIGPMPV